MPTFFFSFFLCTSLQINFPCPQVRAIFNDETLDFSLSDSYSDELIDDDLDTNPENREILTNQNLDADKVSRKREFHIFPEKYFLKHCFALLYIASLDLRK